MGNHEDMARYSVPSNSGGLLRNGHRVASIYRWRITEDGHRWRAWSNEKAANGQPMVVAFGATMRDAIEAFAQLWEARLEKEEA